MYLSHISRARTANGIARLIKSLLIFGAIISPAATVVAQQKLVPGPAGWGGNQQSMCTVINDNTLKLTSQISEREVSGLTSSSVNASINRVTQQSFQSGGAMLSVSGATKLNHNGFLGRAPAGQFHTPSYDGETYGVTIAARFDGSRALDLKTDKLTLGIFTGYNHADITLDQNQQAAAKNLSKSARAEVEQLSVGGYALYTNGHFYSLGIVSKSWSTPEVENFVTKAKDKYGANSVSGSAMLGVIVPVAGDLKVDIRSGLTYARTLGDDYIDSAKAKYTNSDTHDLSATGSAKLFSRQQFLQTTVRPFIQTGLSHRLDYANGITFNGTNHSFTESGDLTAFGRVGIDFDLNSLQSYIAVGGDVSSNSESVSVQVGLTLKID